MNTDFLILVNSGTGEKRHYFASVWFAVLEFWGSAFNKRRQAERRVDSPGF